MYLSKDQHTLYKTLTIKHNFSSMEITLERLGKEYDFDSHI